MVRPGMLDQADEAFCTLVEKKAKIKRLPKLLIAHSFPTETLGCEPGLCSATARPIIESLAWNFWNG